MIAIAGCTDEPTQLKHPRISYSGRASSDTTISSFSAMQIRDRYPSHTTESTTLSAYIYPDTGATTVSFNGMPLICSTLHGYTSYQRILGANSPYIHLNGTNNILTIVGTWNAGFADTILGPSDKTSITSPAYGDTVSKSAGFIVSWSPTSPSQQVAISILDTVRGSRPCGVKYFASDPGSYTFSPSDLSCMAPGPLELTVARGTTKALAASAKRQIHITFSSAEHINLTLAQ
ncbi:MAG: hypothetical protein JST22_11585 [Bacteroidetes bacterium]|nr:hypothetical protein [Bacteroidota bacterium]